jgi:hypothetical protein
MSKTKLTPTTTLVLSASDRGGDGKTTSLVLVADKLASAGRTFSVIDCDMGNCDTPAGFSHWFSKPVDRLDLKSVDDCDALLEQASGSGLEYILADLPANSSAGLIDWLEQSTDPETLREMGLRLIAVCPVDQSSGAPESAAVWMSALGDRADYIVMLNRKTYSPKSKAHPTDKAFDAWRACVERGAITQPFKAVEIGHLHEGTMATLVRLRELPSKAVKNPAMPILCRKRVFDWAKAVHEQLDATGLLVPAAEAQAKV